jgi:hypothetical protein
MIASCCIISALKSLKKSRKNFEEEEQEEVEEITKISSDLASLAKIDMECLRQSIEQIDNLLTTLNLVTKCGNVSSSIVEASSIDSGNNTEYDTNSDIDYQMQTSVENVVVHTSSSSDSIQMI